MQKKSAPLDLKSKYNKIIKLKSNPTTEHLYNCGVDKDFLKQYT